MPNWIVNIIEISGDNRKGKRDIVNFLKQHLHTRVYDEEVTSFFDFNTILPIKDKELEYVPLNERLNGCQPNIQYRRKEWGTKWNSDGNQHFDYDSILIGDSGVSGCVRIVFRTAWNPPLPVAKALILMHPELDIAWDYYSFESQICGSILKSIFDEDKIVHESYVLKGYEKEIL